VSYTFRIKTLKENQEAQIFDMYNSWNITSKHYTDVTFPYTNNTFTITLSNEKEVEYSAIFSIKSISDAFWMILSMTASSYFQLEKNEPLEILRKIL